MGPVGFLCPGLLSLGLEPSGGGHPVGSVFQANPGDLRGCPHPLSCSPCTLTCSAFHCAPLLILEQRRKWGRRTPEMPNLTAFCSLRCFLPRAPSGRKGGQLYGGWLVGTLASLLLRQHLAWLIACKILQHPRWQPRGLGQEVRTPCECAAMPFNATAHTLGAPE